MVARRGPSTTCNSETHGSKPLQAATSPAGQPALMWQLKQLLRLSLVRVLIPLILTLSPSLPLEPEEAGRGSRALGTHRHLAGRGTLGKNQKCQQDGINASTLPVYPLKAVVGASHVEHPAVKELEREVRPLFHSMEGSSERHTTQISDKYSVLTSAEKSGTELTAFRCPPRT
eukprot:6480253-Amphidinium_carterae.2